MVRVHVNNSELLDDLRKALSNAECSVAAVDDETLLVTQPLAVDEAEARLELEFFLKAWQAARPGAKAELIS